MQVINGYQMTGDFSTENAGFCKWGFAEKGGHTYFIKGQYRTEKSAKYRRV